MVPLAFFELPADFFRVCLDIFYGWLLIVVNASVVSGSLKIIPVNISVVIVALVV